MNFKKPLILLIFILSSLAQAAPDTLNFQARIRKNDGTVLEATDVSFFFRYTSADGSCVLFEEAYDNQNMFASGGLVNFQLGIGVDNPTIKYRLIFSSAASLKDTFRSSGTFTCKDGSTYTPTASEIRKLTVMFQYPGSGGWNEIAGIKINAVPYAMHANEAVSAQNFIGNLLGDVTGSQSATVVSRIRGIPVSATAPTNGQILQYNGAQYVPTTLAGAGGTVTNVSSINADIGIANQTTTPVLTLNSGATGGAGDANKIAKLDAAGRIPLAMLPSGAVTSDALAGDVTGTFGATVLSNSGAAAGTYTKVTVDAKGRVTTGAQLDSSDVTTALTYTPVNPTSLSNYLTTAAYATDVADAALCTGIQKPYWNSGLDKWDCVNIQVASTSQAGLVSSVDWNTFNNKVSSQWINNAADIYFNTGNVGIGTLSPNEKLHVDGNVNITGSYMVNGIAIGSSSGTVTNVSSANADIVVANATTTPSLTLNSGATGGAGDANKIAKLDAAGRIPAAMLPSGTVTSDTLTGDVTGTFGATVLSNSGATAGTYTKVTVDAKGRVTTGAQLDSSDVTTALTYTPVNPTALTSYLTMANYATDVADAASCTGIQKPYWNSGTGVWDCANIQTASASQAGLVSSVDWNTFNNKVSSQWTNNAADIYFNTGNVGIGTLSPNEKLHVDGNVNITGSYMVNGIAIGSSSGTVTNVSSANADIVVANATTTPSLTLNSGATGGAGDANKIAKLDAAGRIPAAMLPSGTVTSNALTGDVGGTFGATSVDKIKAVDVTITTLTSGNFLKYNGSAWVNVMPAISDITNLTTQLSNKVDYSQMPAACAANQTLSYSTPSGAWVCTNIDTLNANKITAGSLLATVGGTGQTTYTIGDILYASSTTALSKLAAGANNRVLTSNGPGTAPSWQVAASGGATNIDGLSDAVFDASYNMLLGRSTIGTNGGYNTGVGSNALGSLNNASAFGNVAVGSSALYNSDNASDTTAIGYMALGGNSSGAPNIQDSTFVGSSAGMTGTAGTHTVLNSAGLGYQAGSASTGYNLSLTNSTALGSRALYGRGGTTALETVVVGSNSAMISSGGGLALNYTNSVIVGNNFGNPSLAQTVTGTVSVGHEAGNVITTGSSNTFVGYQAGDTTTTGGSNILIGYQARATASTTSSYLNIGNAIYGDLATKFIGIGATAPRAALDVSSGAIVGRASQVAAATVNFSTGNTQHTTGNCGAFQFNHLKDGGQYIFIVKGTSSTLCVFTSYSDNGTTLLTTYMPPGHTSTTGGTQTMYNITVSGTDVYITWVPGFL